MKKLLIGVVLLLLVGYFWRSGTDGIDQNNTIKQSLTPAPDKKTQEPEADAISFTIKKTKNMLLLSGTFTDKKQLKKFAKNLRPTYSTIHLKKNPQLIDKGGLTLATKILPLFKKNYIQGEIKYLDNRLVIIGSVPSQKILDQMDGLLKNAKISFKNLTKVETKVVLTTPKKKLSSQTKKSVAQAPIRKNHGNKQSRITQNKRATSTHKVPIKEKLIAKKKPESLKGKTTNTKKIKHKKRINMTKTAKKYTPGKSKNTQSKISAKKRIISLLSHSKIEFLAAKDTLTPKGIETVDRLAKILSLYPDIHIEIAGHTDSDGSESSNLKLSQLRVDSVKKRLVSKGISSKRLRANGYGESRPLVPNTSEENKQKNRRVEIHILKRIKI